ncbi:hypothetical protein B4U80_10279, partial [Leptotrombidium deliense]
QSTKCDGTETCSRVNQKVFYHRINSPQSDDILTIQFKDNPGWRMDAFVSDCGKYLFVSARETCRQNLLFYSKLDTENTPIVGQLELTPIFDKFEADYIYVTNDGDKVTMRTNKNAPNFKVVCFDLNDPTEEKWTNVIEEHEKDVLSSCTCVNEDMLAVIYLRDVVNVLEIRKLKDGTLIQ